MQDSTPTDLSISAPPLHLLLTEPLRAAREYIDHHRRCTGRLPRGDGHLVVIFPGLATDHLAVRPLRRRLRELGYDATDWGHGFNTGPGRDLDAWIQRLVRHVHHLIERRRRRQRRGSPQASLIGWSLGGLYAREAAKLLGNHVRQVITIGTPFNAPSPAVTHAAWLYRLLNGAPVPRDHELLSRLRQPPPQPTTAIYSRNDGIVAWQACRHGGTDASAMDVELNGSHLGMGWNPEVVEVVARRLARRRGRRR